MCQRLLKPEKPGPETQGVGEVVVERRAFPEVCWRLQIPLLLLTGTVCYQKTFTVILSPPHRCHLSWVPWSSNLFRSHTLHTLNPS